MENNSSPRAELFSDNKVKSMSEIEQTSQESASTNQSSFILLGALIGALTGAGAGYLLAHRLEQEQDFQLTARDGIKIGGSLIAFLRQVSTLGK